MIVGQLKTSILKYKIARLPLRTIILFYRYVKNKIVRPPLRVIILFYRYVKENILKNKYGKKFLRIIVLIYRQLSLIHWITRIAFQKKIRNKILHSPFILDLLINYEKILEKFLLKLEKISIKRNDRQMLYRISQIYRFQRQHQKAFDILYPLLLKVLRERKSIELILEKIETARKAGAYIKKTKINATLNSKRLNERKIETYLVKAIQAESKLQRNVLYGLYNNKLLSFHDKAKYLMQCQFTLQADNIVPEWNKILKSIRSKTDFLMINWAILAALGHQKIRILYQLGNILISKKEIFKSGEQQNAFERSVTVLAAAYYRTGERKKLLQLDKLFNFEVPSWKIYMSFGKGKIMEAMDYRAIVIKNTFLRSYPYKEKNKKQTLVPEKDICGEAFNALYYRALNKTIGKFYVVCDARLSRILRQNFPFINFIPKTPRYMHDQNQERFNYLNYGLRDFLDNDSAQKTLGSKFFSIDYSEHHEKLETQKGRINGWLKPNKILRNRWRKKLGRNKKLIGVCANSTLRSRIRDMHMIGMDKWDKIFKLPGYKFINLNASLTDEEIDEYSKKFKIEFINPKIDLFNDFDNLLSIMSLLDIAIVPPNNMMDFSAALGIKSIVFSPSNIMQAWAVNNNNYIFSENVKFIFPEEKENKNKKMVMQAVKHIKSLNLN